MMHVAHGVKLPGARGLSSPFSPDGKLRGFLAEGSPCPAPGGTHPSVFPLLTKLPSSRASSCAPGELAGWTLAPRTAVLLVPPEEQHENCRGLCPRVHVLPPRTI